VICSSDDSVSYLGNGKEIERLDKSINDYITRRMKE
jgi:hypothetical protein